MSSPGRWYFYDLATGRLTGRTLSGLAELLQANTPAGQGAVQVPPGTVLDARNRRVNLATGQVEPWQPPAPPDTELTTWAWDDATERWVAEPTAAAEQQRIAQELTAAMAEREAGQARAQREILLALARGQAAPAEAVARLAEIEAAVAPLRLQLAQAAPVRLSLETERAG